MRYLFIAEKPNTMKEYKSVYDKNKKQIESYLGFTIDFVALRGHVFRNVEPKEYKNKPWNIKWRSLYDNYLPMIPDRWEIQPIDSAQSVIDNLKAQLSSKYDGIIVGTDSDVEGYGIYYMVMTALKLSKYKTLRFYETSLTEKDILKSFLSMEDLFTTPRHKNAVDAYIFRSHWDWLIGMNLSTAYTVRYNNLMRVGSVKAPTLKLIYDNCKAIDEFSSTKSFAILSDYEDGNIGSMINDNNLNDRVFPNKEEADKVLAILSKEAKVTSFKKTKNEVQPEKLYSLSDLQVDASKIGYTPDQTLKVAEELYLMKLLSYPRTACNYLSSGKVGDLLGIVSALGSIPCLNKFTSSIDKNVISRVKKDKNIINDVEVAKEPHDALIPTGQFIDWNSLSKSQQDIYLLVCKRYLAHFMDRFIEEKYVLLLDNNNYPFKVNGRKTIQLGFYEMLEKNPKDIVLKEYKAGDILDIKESREEERESKPPKRFTSGSIIDAMKGIAKYVTDPNLKKVMKDSEGIGTEATRAGIITELQKSKYIDLKKNAIYITDAGKLYIESIRKQNSDGTYDYGFADPVKVAYWSSRSKEIQLGKSKLDDVYKEFCDYLSELINQIKESGKPSARYNKITSWPACPCCGKELASGKFGVYCKEKCGFSIGNVVASRFISDEDKMSLIENKKTKKLQGFKSKSGNQFSARLIINESTNKVEFSFEN